MTPADLTSWERDQLAAVEATAGPLPLYASGQWWALPPADPRRWASVVRAAACWRYDSRLDVIDARVQAELARVDALALERVRAASHDVAGARDWTAVASSPTHAELEHRRGAS